MATRRVAPALRRYAAKRQFDRTPEPDASLAAGAAGHRYLIQKHAATRLHYDFRLELDGTLKSWAVTKGPSLDPAVRRLAVHVEDHPLAYGDFEGIIPKGQYGGGTVMLWDSGAWSPLEKDPGKSYAKGRLKFTLDGDRLKGGWMLVRMGGRAQEKGHDNWLLIKERDEFAKPGKGDVLIDAKATSVVSGHTMEEIAGAPKPRTWQSSKPKAAKPAAQKRAKIAPAKIAGAKKARQPDFIAPELATLVERPPAGPGWIHEIKIDGYRAYGAKQGGAVRLLTRTGQDWTHRFTPIAQALAALPVPDFAVDGEIAVMDDKGLSNFGALQQALSTGEAGKLRYIVFDMLHLDGRDLRGAALGERKRLLRQLIPETNDLLLYSDHVDGTGEAVYQHACRLAVEGVVSKRIDRPYRSGRGKDWLKSKCIARQEFIILGFTDPKTTRDGIGALALGYHEDGELRYAGRVGTGFTQAVSRDLARRLGKRQTDTPAVAKLPAAARRGLHWVKPGLVCEIEFLAWTADGLLRHPSFQGLREDKPAKAVTRERSAPVKAVAATKKTAPSASAPVAGVAISHPDRVIFPDGGITKRQLADYYAAIAETMLPHLENRPLNLLRCPGGIGEECFFQKHFVAGLKGLPRVSIQEKHGKGDYVMVRDAGDLVALIQQGVIEIHPWGARADDPDKPDQIIFDFDPAPGLEWGQVVRAAKAMRDFLEGLGLASFVKTTGGKGLHVIAPLRRELDWPTVKDFARAVAASFVKAQPDGFTVSPLKRERTGKIFIDYLRNDHGQTAVAPYCVRARPGAPVAMPIAWSEVTARLQPGRFTLTSVPGLVAARKADPWKDMLTLRQAISRAARRVVGLD